MIIDEMNFENYWGLGDWGWGIGDWPNPESPIPNPESPIPNPQSPIPISPASRVRVHDVVERVALDGLAPRGADEPLELARGHRLGRSGARHVIDALFLHRAVEIVDTEPQR